MTDKLWKLLHYEYWDSSCEGERKQLQDVLAGLLQRLEDSENKIQELEYKLKDYINIVTQDILLAVDHYAECRHTFGAVLYVLTSKKKY